MGTDGPLIRDICCFPGAQVKDVVRNLPTLVQPSCYYPLLTFQVSSSEHSIGRLRAIKRVFRALGWLVDGSGAQVMFSFISLVAGINVGRTGKAHQINAYLWDWYHWQDFGGFGHGLVYTTSGLLVTDGVHLSQRRKKILIQELAGLTEGAKNCIRRGKGMKQAY